MRKYHTRKVTDKETQKTIISFINLDKDFEGQFVVPDGIEIIAKGAFAECRDLTTVKLPSTLKKINEGAFSSCSKLKSIVVPRSVVSIAKRAFANCSELTTVKLPSSLKEIGEEAFEGCYSLTDIVIPEGVITINKRTFSCCDTLATVKFPTTLKEIGEEAFENCDSLTGVIIPEGVETIAERAFSNCSELATVILPSTLKKLGGMAFKCCSLTNIVVPEGITVIPSECFASSSLSEVNLPNSLITIEDNAFNACELKCIKLPDSVESIGYRSFFDNKADTIYVGASMRVLGEDALWCNTPHRVEVAPDNSVFTDAGCNVIMEKRTGRIVFGATYSTIPENAKAIARSAFRNAPQVIIIPSSVETIENGAFCFCGDDVTIILQEGVKTIEWQAFQALKGQKITVYIPSTVTKIDGQASYVDFHLDAANKSYTYDAEGMNLISDTGNLVWGRLLKGVPSNVTEMSLVIEGLNYSQIIIPGNVHKIQPSTIQYSSGIDKFIMSRGVHIFPEPYDTWRTGCDIEIIVDEEDKGQGIVRKSVFVIPAGTDSKALQESMGNESIIGHFFKFDARFLRINKVKL